MLALALARYPQFLGNLSALSPTGALILDAVTWHLYEQSY